MPGAGSAADRIDALSARMQQDVAEGNAEDGLAVTNELLALVRRKFGPRHMNYAAVLTNQATFLHNLGRYQEAVDRYREALAIKERLGDPASLLRTEAHLAGTYLALQRFDDAKAMAERALDTATRAFGADDLRVPGILGTLGSVAKNQERYKDAEGYFARALAILDPAPQSEERDRAEADITQQLGDLYGLEGRFDDGERLLLRGETLMQRNFGPSSAMGAARASLLMDLGNLYSDAGRYGAAIKAFEEAAAIDRAALGDDHPNVAAVLGNLARAYEATSRFAEAEPLYEKVLATDERVFGQDSPATATDLQHLANLYFAQRRYADAAGLDARVVSILEKAFGPAAPDLARVLHNLALAKEFLGELDSADELYRRALRIMEDRFGRDSVQSAMLLQNMGELAARRDRLDEAADDLRRALASDEKFYGKSHRQIAQDLNLLAGLEIDRGVDVGARGLLDRALAICRASVGPRDLLTMSVLYNLAKVSERAGDWTAALGFLREAGLGGAQWMLREGKSSQDRPTGADAELRERVYPALVQALWHVGAADPARMDEAFVAAQRAQETKAGAALAQMAARFAARSDGFGAAVRRRQDLAAGLATLEARVAGELGKPEGRRDDALIANLRAESARKQQDFDAETTRLTRDFPAFRELAMPAPLPVAEVQALLRPDEALFVMSVAGDTSYVFVVTKEGSAWQEIEAGRQDLAERVTKLRKGLFDATAASQPAKFDLQAAYDLYRLLFGGVETAIAGKSKLIVVPDGALTSLPFHVLVTRPPDPASPAPEIYRKAAWLLRDKAIAVLPAVSNLRALRVFAKVSRAPKPFIGFGDPRLQLPGGAATRMMGHAAPQPPAPYSRGVSLDFAALSRGLAPLPETAGELRAIAQALGAPASDVHLGDAASVTNVEKDRLDQYKVIDFATHGLVAGDVKGLAEPALVLSLPASPTPADDGLLTASRIANLELDADWAVLSACNTAAGETPGAEGLSGLARAFFYAGARALLVSHWPVETEAAVKLTTGTFAALAKDPKIGRADAFRRAMLALIDDPASPDLSDPGVWAPFVLVGDGN